MDYIALIVAMVFAIGINCIREFIIFVIILYQKIINRYPKKTEPKLINLKPVLKAGLMI